VGGNRFKTTMSQNKKRGKPLLIPLLWAGDDRDPVHPCRQEEEQQPLCSQQAFDIRKLIESGTKPKRSKFRAEAPIPTVLEKAK
jgi:hypothetical protein